jgi:Lon protease-like protein
MTDWFQPSDALPDSFDGRVRIFPLPNLVLFPHVVLPLHIFERRYRAMVADALEHDGLIAMALLQPGWEGNDEGRPPVHPMCCLGRIAQHRRLPDGRYYLLLHGLARVRIRTEHDTGKPFRTADATVHEDVDPAATDDAHAPLRSQLHELLANVLPEAVRERLLQSQIPLGMLADVVAYTLDLDVLTKQQLLDQTDVAARAEQLVAALENALLNNTIQEAIRHRYPFKFSDN